MLHISALTYRLGERLLIDNATAALPSGAHVGLVGRNGAGKTTLFRLIRGDLSPEGGAVVVPKGLRVGSVEQEAPGGAESLIEFVLSADTERAALIAEAEIASDPERIAEIQTRLVDIEAHTAPARAAQILKGLGFDEAAQGRPLAEYSGGWRMRVALAAVLFSEPDLLLLDEPTNYLDLEGVLWLTDYLKSCPATIVVISHDRDLLDDVADQILHLERGKLTLWSGGYSSFERQRREQPSSRGQGDQEAGGAARPFAGLRRSLSRQGDESGSSPVAHQDAGQDGADRGDRRRDRAAVQVAAGRPAPEPADRDDGQGQRRLRRARGYRAHRPHARRRRPHRPPRPERQRQIDLRQADRRAARADGGQDDAREQASGRLFRPAPDRRARARRQRLRPCRRTHAWAARSRRSAAARR